MADTMTELDFEQKCLGDCENCLNSIKYRCPFMPQEYLEELEEDSDERIAGTY